MSTKLDSAVRGDTFSYSFTLGSGWTGSDFTGGVRFTLRERIPDSSVTDDADAIDQATTTGGEITFSGATGTVTIPASRTTLWPTKVLLWDLSGTVSGATPLVYTIDSGTILIRGDVTRSS